MRFMKMNLYKKNKMKISFSFYDIFSFTFKIRHGTARPGSPFGYWKSWGQEFTNKPKRLFE